MIYFQAGVYHIISIKGVLVWLWAGLCKYYEQDCVIGHIHTVVERHETQQGILSTWSKGTGLSRSRSYRLSSAAAVSSNLSRQATAARLRHQKNPSQLVLSTLSLSLKGLWRGEIFLSCLSRRGRSRERSDVATQPLRWDRPAPQAAAGGTVPALVLFQTLPHIKESPEFQRCIKKSLQPLTLYTCHKTGSVRQTEHFCLPQVEKCHVPVRWKAI